MPNASAHKKEQERGQKRPADSDSTLLSAVFGGLGLIAGATLDDSFFGGVVGLALGLVLARWRAARIQARRLSEALGLLEMRVQSLEGAAQRRGPEAGPAADPAPSLPVPEPETREDTAGARPADQSEAATPDSPWVVATPPRRETARRTPSRRPPRPDPIRTWFDFARNFLLGGNTVARVGVLVLLVGVTLLAKWAADHALFPIEARLAFASLIGVSLTAVGYRLRTSRPAFATTLQGGGLAALYLVVFAAFRQYGLVPAGMAFSLFAIIAAAGCVLAVLQSSQPLIFISSLGGFLAPILTSTGAGDHVVLFAYYLVLNIAIAGVAWFRSWRPLNLLAFVSTYGVATAWGVLRYRPEDFASTEPFLLAFGVLFTSIAVLFAWRTPPRLNGLVDGTLVFGTPLVSLLAQAHLVKDMEFGLAYSAAGFGLFYAVIATWLWRTAPETLRRLCEGFVALAVGFGTMAIPFAFENSLTVSIAWALEGAGLYWVGTRQHRRLPRFAAIALQLLAAVAFGIALADRGHASWTQDFTVLANGRFFSCLALAFAGLFIAREAWTARSQIARNEWRYSQIMALWGVGWWAGGICAEIDQFAPRIYEAAILVGAIGLTGLALERGARALDWLPGRLTALVTLPAALVTIPLALDNQPHLLAHWGIAAWPFCLWSIYQVLARLDADGPDQVAHAYAPALWLLALVGAIGLAGIADVGISLGGDWPVAGFGLALGLLLLASRFAIEGSVGPWGRHSQIHLFTGMAPVVGAALLWSLAANLDARGDTSPLPYLPLLNPLDASVAVAGVSIIGWWMLARREDPSLAEGAMGRLAPMASGAAAFVWLNGVLVRSTHQWTDVAFRADALWDSVPLQVALSISWTLVALVGMLLSTRRARRAPWVACATLLGVVVVKLFVVDLSQLSTVAKIGTFLVVGVLLLVVGYLSPVPPGSEDHEGGNEEPPPDPDDQPEIDARDESMMPAAAGETS